jgi:UDP-N-acetylglucosamine:LPS N-acetylglucosamine transferase
VRVEPRGSRSSVRILVLTCEEGEGHTSTARALAAELGREPNVEVTVRDALNGGLGRLIPLLSRDAYRLQLRWLAWTYGLEYVLFTRFPPARALARFGLALLGSRPLLRVIAAERPDVIVSTHPVTTNVVGALRRRGRLKVPAVATVTDFGVHALWAHRGIDLHVVVHEDGIASVERVAGAGSATVTSALVQPEFLRHRSRAQARRAFGLPETGVVALISGGGWGVGDVEGAVRAALGGPVAAVVCLSGRNEHLQARLEEAFAAEPRVWILPFTDGMSELLAAADVLVDATVGVTCLEALVSGCQIVVYGAPPGHSRDNARALVSLGFAEAAGSPDELAAALATTNGRRNPLPAAPSPASLILAARARVEPSRRLRRLALASAGATLASLVLGGWTFASPTAYPLVARAFHLNPTTAVPTAKSQVALVLAAPANADRVVRTLAGSNQNFTLAVSRPLSHDTATALTAHGNDALPALGSADTIKLLGTSRKLRRLAHQLGLGSTFYYLVAPRSHLTLAEYLATRGVGGHPLAGAVAVTASGSLPRSNLRPGVILVMPVDHGALVARRGLMRVARSLSEAGLRSVSVSTLLRSAASTRATGADRARIVAPIAVRASASTSAASRTGVCDHDSPASAGASATGTNVVSAKMSGAT